MSLTTITDRRVRTQLRADGKTQVDVYLYLDVNDPDDANVASIPYVKQDDNETVEDFVARMDADIFGRIAEVEYHLDNPPPPLDDGGTTEQRLIDTLLTKGVLTDADVTAITTPPIIEPPVTPVTP